MNSVILQLAIKYVKTLLLVFSIIALYRGHNQPGGGFIGGLLAALSFVYTSLAYNGIYLKEKLRFSPEYFISAGLLSIFLSLLPSLFNRASLMKGAWVKVEIFGYTTIKLGTPLLFDLGVYLAVIGVTVLFITSLNTEQK